MNKDVKNIGTEELFDGTLQLSLLRIKVGVMLLPIGKSQKSLHWGRCDGLLLQLH